MSTQSPQPLYFGPPARPLFGWLHVPEPARGRALGVVVCNPFGYESLCTHRTLRELAVSTSEAGFPTLRFDYDGTGDSAGDDFEPDRLAAWVASIARAIDTLKRTAHVERVCLVGMRIGVALAALAAQDRSDVEALIAFVPVVSGKAYLRELRALAYSRPQPSPPKESIVPEGLQEAAGFVLTRETQQSISLVDLTTLQGHLARRVLIMQRDDVRANDAWAKYLESRGVKVDQAAFHGYAAMTESAHQGIVPREAIARCTEWLSGFETQTSSKPVDTASLQQIWSDGAIRESIVPPDRADGLFGIIAEPATGNAADTRDAILLLNSGAISRIGPGRLYVTVAKRFASLGAVVMRLDIAGIGDSPPRAGENPNVVYSHQAQADIKAALALLRERYPSARLHLLGLCSGAYHSFKAAVAGNTLASATLINPLVFFWRDEMSMIEPEFRVTAEAARYQTSVRSLASWMKVLRGEVNVLGVARILLRRVNVAAMHAARDLARRMHIPIKDDLALELRQASRLCRVLNFIFASNDPGYQLLHEQGGSAVRRMIAEGRIHIEVISGADHTFTAYWSRIQLIELLTTQFALRARQRTAELAA